MFRWSGHISETRTAGESPHLSIHKPISKKNVLRRCRPGRVSSVPSLATRNPQLIPRFVGPRVVDFPSLFPYEESTSHRAKPLIDACHFFYFCWVRHPMVLIGRFPHLHPRLVTDIRDSRTWVSYHIILGVFAIAFPCPPVCVAS